MSTESKKNKISNSALDTYQLCPRKYAFRYKEHLKGDYMSTSLLYGSAMDSALNYILESIRDKKEWSIETACNEFDRKMNEWSGQNRLEFFKNEVPEELKDSIDPDDLTHQGLVWENICKRGINSLFVYDKEIIPLIEEVLHVQQKFEVKNEDDDTFTGFIDFIAKLKDGRTVLFDNKTASAKYKKKAVVDSQQLSFYLEQYPQINLAGYIVLIKDPSREKGMTHQILIDEIPELTKSRSFKLLDETMQKIKNEEFPCNTKGCKAFGKECEYMRACVYGDYGGLISTKKEDSIVDNKPKE